MDTSNLFYIHGFKDIPESLLVSEGVYFGGDFGMIKDILETTPEEVGINNYQVVCFIDVHINKTDYLVIIDSYFFRSSFQYILDHSKISSEINAFGH